MDDLKKKRNLKILVISNMFPDETHPFYGIFVKRFCDELDNLNINYSLSVLTKKDSKLAKIINYIKFYLISFLKLIFLKYDYVYVHYASHSSPPVILAKKLKNIKIITNVHGSDVIPQTKKQEKLQVLTKSILQSSDKIVVPSQYFKECINNKYHVYRNIYVYPSGGINKKIFYPSQTYDLNESFGDNYKIVRNNLTLGFASRIIKNKGWDTFIEAISILENKGFKGTYIIVGEGPEKDNMIKLIKDRNLDSKIRVLDMMEQSQLAKFYRFIDLFVFPTKCRESLGLVGIESMACGTPVIASDFSAPKYYVVNNFNGFKFNVGDAKDLSNKILLYNNLSLREKKNLSNNALLTANKYKTEKVRYILKEVIDDE